MPNRPSATVSLFAFALSLALVASLTPFGCSDDGGSTSSADTSPDGNPDIGEDIPSDVAPDGSPDAETGDSPVFVPNENEPNSPDDPTNITLPARLFGTIGEPSDDPDVGTLPDADGFRFEAEAGAVLRLTLAQSNIEPSIIIETEDFEAEVFISRLLDSATPGLTRQVFIPATGSYVVIVEDERNIEWELTGEGEPVGGDDLIYELVIQPESITTESITLPFDQSATDLPEGNGVRVLAVTLPSAGLFLADLDAQSLEPPADLDSALLLMNEDLTELVAENDDEDVAFEVYDSLIRDPVSAGSYRLVVDFYSAGANNSHDLRVLLADPAIEVEPTEGPESAWPLPIVGADEEPFSVTGTIEAPLDDLEGDFADFDWFDLGDLAVGQTVEIVVRATEESPMQPRLLAGGLLEGFFGPDLVAAQARPGPDGSARFELTAVFDGPHVVIVGDDRNFEDDPDAGPLEAVGGETYTYLIQARVFERSDEALGSTPATTTSALDPAGNVQWLTFETDREGLLVIHVTTELFDPTVWFLDRAAGEGRDPLPIGELLEIGDHILVRPTELGAPLQIAVLNEGLWPDAGTPAAFDLAVTVPQLELGQEDDLEGGDFPDANETPLLIPSSGAAWEGALSGATPANADTDVFRIDLSPGQRLYADTYGLVPDDAEEPANADTIITLDGPGLDEPLEGDDTDEDFFSRLEFDVPEEGTGTYTITVSAFCLEETCDDGAYGLRVLTVGGEPD